MNKKQFVAAFVIFSSILVSMVPSAQASSRSVDKIGLSLGLISEPAVSLLGYNLSYNLDNRLRVTAGYGSVSSSGSGFNIDVKTIGLNAKYFLLDWNFAPFVGAGASSISGTVNGTGDVGGIGVSGTGVLFSGLIGVDWQTSIGFLLGVEYALLFGKGIASGTGVPGFYFGWVF
jgi:hypothetical protein